MFEISRKLCSRVEDIKEIGLEQKNHLIYVQLYFHTTNDIPRIINQIIIRISFTI